MIKEKRKKTKMKTIKIKTPTALFFLLSQPKELHNKRLTVNYYLQLNKIGNHEPSH